MGRAGGAKEYIAARIAVEDRGYSTPCWVWQKCLTEKGYGRAQVPELGRMRVHRATYQLYVGQIPEGLVVDHLCRVKACCNPDHLEAVTNEENQRRAAPFRMFDRRPQTHCSRGHELIQENRCSHGCRLCRNDYMREWHRRNSMTVSERGRQYRVARREELNSKKREKRGAGLWSTR
jgi:hypothetical protein